MNNYLIYGGILGLEGLVDDLENLFYAYLKTWIKSNNEIQRNFRKRKNNFIQLKLQA